MQLSELQTIAKLPLFEQWETLISQFQGPRLHLEGEVRVLFETIAEQIANSSSLLQKQKVQFFEEINIWGDPRLRSPKELQYWVELTVADSPMAIAKHLVTIKEWQMFLAVEYDNDQHWSEEGLNWRNNRRVTWQDLAGAPDSQKYMFDNQPVVGVSWYEAEAYATCHQSRLMEFFEREEIVRGVERRRYPWGRDFKHGYANTEESGLDKPSAVGVFSMDKTPDGIFDLAGNVAEWQGDDMDDQRVVHPGCWANGSISTWAKASERLSPNARLAYLGFRLVRDQ